MIHTMTNEEIITYYSKSRNLSEKTKINQKTCLTEYSQYNNMLLKELLTEAENEEEQGIRWKQHNLQLV